MRGGTEQKQDGGLVHRQLLSLLRKKQVHGSCTGPVEHGNSKTSLRLVQFPCITVTHDSCKYSRSNSFLLYPRITLSSFAVTTTLLY